MNNLYFVENIIESNNLFTVVLMDDNEQFTTIEDLTNSQLILDNGNRIEEGQYVFYDENNKSNPFKDGESEQEAIDMNNDCKNLREDLMKMNGWI